MTELIDAVPTAPEPVHGDTALAEQLGLHTWQIRTARQAGVLPAEAADLGLEDVRTRITAICAERPVGAHRAAQRLAEHLDLNVQADDVRALAATGTLPVAEQFTPKRSRRPVPLYAAVDLDDLTIEQVHAVLERGERLLTAEQAAARIHVDRRHLDLAVQAGWLTATSHHDKLVGVRRTVSVALYRTDAVDALLQRSDVDWQHVRATPGGQRSPLLDILGDRRVQPRAQQVRAFAAQLGRDYDVEVWSWYLPGPDRWEVDWSDRERLTEQHAADVLGAHRAARHSKQIDLNSPVGAAIRFARRALEPGRAVIVDTETTDLFGRVCEIAIIDAASGRVLLDTLVNPQCPIEQDAFAVHRISDADVTAPDVPTWPEIYRRVLRITRGRMLLAYNADYDRTVIADDCARYGIRHSRLAASKCWEDVMEPRADHARSPVWLPNEGGHRALGDVRQTRRHLQRMVRP